MTCFHPLKAFKTGLKTDNGKDLLYITNRPGSFVPIEQAQKSLKVKIPFDSNFVTIWSPSPELYNFIPVPCGQCVGCKLDHAREWAVRCTLEASQYRFNYFVTLTYDDLHLGKNKLSVRDPQLFFKRLRKRFPNVDIRYFGCGEYGSLTFRKHWHFIIFNLPLNDLIALPGKSKNGYLSYRSPLVESCWDHGFVEVDEFSFSAASYVARYCMKKVGDDSSVLLMSRRPGIGRIWLDEHIDELKKDPCLYGSFGSSHRVPLPAYFKKVCSDPERFGEEWLLGLQEVAKNNAERSERLFINQHGLSDEELVGMYKDKLKKDQIRSLRRKL